jgi:hypothetical protein
MNRWKHLREKYIRCGKKPASGSVASSSERDWEYYSSLKWLDAYTKGPSNKFIFRATYRNSIVCKIFPA